MGNSSIIKILLADDDQDDCFLFLDALEELDFNIQFKSVHDGEQLMHHLLKISKELPTVLFLDLNMPRKNGFECLKEIRQSEKLKSLPIIIFSTSFDEQIADVLYGNGAHYFICKPTDFSTLRILIGQALTIVTENKDENGVIQQPPKELFLISRVKAPHF